MSGPGGTSRTPAPGKVRRCVRPLTRLALALGGAGEAWALLCNPASAAAPAEAQASPPAEAAYVDRLIDGGSLAPEVTREEPAAAQQTGNVRSLVVELGGSITAPRVRIDGVAQPGGDAALREAGLRVTARYQSDNLGLLGLDAQLRRGSSPGPFGSAAQEHWSGSVTATSRALPLGDGWLADLAAGATAMPVSELARRQSRFFLPSLPILGAQSVLRRYAPLGRGASSADPEPTASVNLAVGEPGLFGGVRLSDFSGLGGLAVSGGGQVLLAPRWTAALQALAVRDTRDPYAAILQTAPPANQGRIAAEAGYAALVYSGEGVRVQANGIWSHRSGGTVNAIVPAGGALGGWLDARLRIGRASHSAGLYYFEPGLAWGTSALINNARGGYYRFASSSQRWRWTVNLDAVEAVSTGGSSGLIGNVEVRRKLTFTTWTGVSSTVRRTRGQTSGQVLGFVDFSNRLGETRAELGWAHDPGSDIYRMGLNHHWHMPDWLPSGSRLSTQVSYQLSRQEAARAELAGSPAREQASSIALGLSAGAAPFSGVSFDATLAYNSDARLTRTGAIGPIDLGSGALGSLSSQQGQAFSATVVASMRLSPQWSLSASYTDATSQLTARYGLLDPAFAVPGLLPDQLGDRERSTFRLRAAFLTLRFTGSAGRPRGSLGVRTYPVGGTGNVEGRVFLDANDNQRHEAGEAGAAGIVIILDGIQAVRTDASGYYRFEGVADGPHRITLNADALPLPWVIEAEGKRGTGAPYVREIELGVRETLRLDIPGRKE